MSLQIPNGFALCSYRWSLVGDAEELVSTVGVDFAAMTGGDQDNSNAIADQFLNGFGSAEFSNQYTYKGVTSRVGYSGGGIVTFESPRSIVGGFTGPPVPQNCCILVRKRTTLIGRKGQGRMYLPPFALNENAINQAGVIDPANVPGIQLNVTQWFDPSYPWYLLHEAPPVGGVETPPTPITAFVVDSVIATQRRRLRR